MRHRLASIAAVVDNHAIARIRDTELTRESRNGLQHFPEKRSLFRRRRVEPRNWPLWKQQDVPRRWRMCFMKGEPFIGFMHDARGDFSRGDSFKNGHGLR